jgi:ABC-2 type transport system ATP-binding protein
MIQVIDLTKYYRRVPVVHDVSFSIGPGQVTGYLGPNGSGKSTTVKMLAGFIEPNAGKILFNGENIRNDIVGYKARIGYVPEEAHVYPSMTAMEYLQLMGRLRGLPESQVEAKAKDLLQLFSLFLRRHSPLASYSKGMRQRVLIASALLHDPNFLIFDEPLSGMDVSSVLLFRHLVAELAARGKHILYISHVLEVVEKVCTDVVILYKGRIMANDGVGQLRDLMKLPSLEEIFSQLVQQEDMEAVARDIVDAIQRPPAR